ncbi:DNA-binding transcriptional regulator, XRE-family HTH domain [Pseudobutyrivibrio sp. YE44]|uniref:helix-turn-helix domain-containing protein n=1 Tax=Pseudobutyrivibrio sp. YE44 TaxID=1520802 RepID=UPI000889810C|nr:helix-turn-helix transcriptional regulator [Pseudobutyrivibrio sp. YE44]SDB54495.1 DNA-binding transcriptional regulator, XRE-family HTH domain [Pseudobutyrivibrio sp. YE44]
MEGNIQSNRLKELRKNSKLTQEQMAKYLGVDQSMITKLENGTRVLNVTLIEKICSLFCCTEEYLFGVSDEYIPIKFAFRANSIMTEDLESIAAVNRLAKNIRYMNKMIGE